MTKSVDISVRIPSSVEDIPSILDEVRKQLNNLMTLTEFNLSDLIDARTVGVVGPRCCGKTTVIKNILSEINKKEPVYGICYSSLVDPNIAKYMPIVTPKAENIFTQNYMDMLPNWFMMTQQLLGHPNAPTLVHEDFVQGTWRKQNFKVACQSYGIKGRFIYSEQFNSEILCDYLFLSPLCVNLKKYVSVNDKTINNLRSQKGFFVIKYKTEYGVNTNEIEKIFTYVPNQQT
jgi:hypothetical protein